MLLQLCLKNFILAETLEIDFTQGFGVLTGETGAGKSILLDALQCVTGARADVNMIRADCDKANVSATFSIAKNSATYPLLSDWDIEVDDEVLLRRVLDRQGRHKAYINGAPVTLSQLSQVGDTLLEIHGQNESMQLMRPVSQRTLLDEFAQLQTQLQTLQKYWGNWQNLKEQCIHAEKHQDELHNKQEYLLLQQGDLKNVLTPEDWEHVNRRHQQLAHVQSLQVQAFRALSALSEEEVSTEKLLNSALTSVEEMCSVDDRVQDVYSLLASAKNEMTEAERLLRQYLDKLESDPQDIEEIEQQLQVQMELSRKYRVRPESLSELQTQVDGALAEMESGLDLEALKIKSAAAEKEYVTLATVIHQTRKKTAKQLSDEVTRHLPDLGMKNARFQVECLPAEPTASGTDNIQFQVSGLAGSTFRPMAKVVSGGELSRLALALFLALHGGQSKTYIFDEVDAGIGGAVAEAVGRMLAELARKHKEGQILCVTHLAQVASCANWHGLVEKFMDTHTNTAKSSVKVLSKEKDRLEEIARMLGGLTITETTRKHAKEMLRLPS